MLIVARGNPRLPTPSDSPVKLVASDLKEWGKGRGEGDTTLLNNWGTSQIKKFNLALWAWKKFILTPTRYQKEKVILPIKNSQDALQKRRAKIIIFTACHSGKLKLAFTSPDVISTSPKSFLTNRINFTVLLLFKFLKKHQLPVGQVKNRIH